MTIRDINMFMLYDNYSTKKNFDEHDPKECDPKLKHLVLSYKSEGINTYNVFVFNIETRMIRLWHESYNLYEDRIKSVLLPSNEFIILNCNGMMLLNIGNSKKKIIVDNKGFSRMVHSLGGCNYLRLEENNHLFFKCQYYNDR